MFNIEASLFYIFSTMAILSSLMVTLSKHPIRSILFLVLTFFTTAVLWMLLEAEFLAVTLILVYVGAVLVLFLFVIMMLDVEVAAMREGFARFLPLGIGVSFLMILMLVYALRSSEFATAKPLATDGSLETYSNIQALGTLLYTDYLYPFEVAGILLLVSIIAAISLTYRKRRSTKMVNPDQQVRVSKEDRIRLIKLQSGKEKS